MRLEICGGIAAGKTTLANALSEVGYSPLLEDFRANPFWEAFYRDPKRHAFETEVSFLLQHYHAVKCASDAPPPVADFSFVLDLAYARIGLSGKRLRIFQALLDEVVEELGNPHLTVVLRCSADIAFARIRARARAQEASITPDWLASLGHAVYAIAATRHDDQTVWIDSEELDFRPGQSERDVAVGLVLEAWDRAVSR